MPRVLIAEDETPVRELLGRVLAIDGYDVRTAADGAAAMAILAEEEPFDLLLTDIRMPIMDGIALALTAKRDHPQLRIVLMTGYAGERERAHGLDALVHEVMLKPFSLAYMRDVLRRALA